MLWCGCVSYLSSSILLKFPSDLMSWGVSTSAVSPPTLKYQRSFFPSSVMPRNSLLDYKHQTDRNELQTSLKNTTLPPKTSDKTAQKELLCCRGDAYILVAEVEDKLFDAVVLPPRSGRLRQSDVELEGGVGSQVSEVTWSTDLNARLPVKLHGNADLDGGERAPRTLEAAGGQTLLIVCVCVCVPCWRRFAPAGWADGCGRCSRRCSASVPSDSAVCRASSSAWESSHPASELKTDRVTLNDSFICMLMIYLIVRCCKCFWNIFPDIVG